jgi:GT2 family glycosyltransferase
MTLTTPVLPEVPEPDGPVRRAPARIVAVLVAHDGARWLPRALRAVAEQTRRPDVVVAVDTGSGDGSADLLRAALGPDHVLTAPRRTGFGAAVALGLRHAAALAADRDVDDPTTDWVWLLHDDCAPDPDALHHLLDAGAASARVGVVGPKLVAWDDPTRLLEVGVTVSRGGRREDTLDGAVRDQGQHDGRCDVLAVGTAGMLARRDLWDRLDGLDPALPLLRDDVDLCWRAHLAGSRVVVAPRAVVADAQAATRRLRPADAVRGAVRRADRRHGVHVALARCSPWAVPLVVAQVLLQALCRAVGLLAAKAPREALDEVLAVGAVLLAPWRWIGSRWRARASRQVPRSSVSPLLVPRSAVLRRAADAVVAWRHAQRDDGAAVGHGPGVPPEPGPTADAAQPQVLAPARWPRRVALAPLTWVLLGLAAATAVAARGIVGIGALTGGALGRVSGDGRGLWQDAVGTLRGPGLGTSGAAPPYDVLRAGAVRALEVAVGDRAAALAVDLLVLGAPMLSAVAAYLGAATATRSRAARAWAAAMWGASPLLTTATAQGRLGPVAVHVLLPLVAAAVARALGRRGTVTAMAAAALGLALVGSVLPSVLLLGAVVALGGVVLGHGAVRLRAAGLLVLPVALLGPWLLELVARPALLLAGPGAVDVGPAADSGSGLPGLLRFFESVVDRPVGWPAWTLAVPFVPLLVAGLLGILRGGPRGRAATAAWIVTLLAVAGALVLPHVVLVGPSAGGAVPAVRGWPGGVLDVGLLGVLAAALIGIDGLNWRSSARWRRVLVAPVLLACVLAPLAAAGWAWRGSDVPLERGALTALPAVAADAAAGPRATRTLVLGNADGVVTYRLAGREPEAWTRNLPGRELGAAEPDGLAAERTDAGSAAGSAAASLVAARAVEALLAPEGTGSGPVGTGTSGAPDAASADPVAALRRLAIGFVLVQEPVPGPTAERLDSLGGLTRIGAPRGGRLWRVGAAQDPATARVHVLDPSGAPASVVPVSGSHAAVHATLAAGAQGRRLLLSEVASTSWRASLDGRRLAPVTASGDWRQAFALPASGGHLVVEHVDPRHKAWRWAQLGLLALLLLLALPVRRPGTGS